MTATTMEHPAPPTTRTDHTARPERNKPPLLQAARAGSAIGFSTIAALLIGFVLQLTIAYRFGAGGDTDAFFMAQGMSELLAKILLGGSLTSVFLPIFVEHLTHGQPERAWKLANHLLHLSAAVSFAVLLLMGFFTDTLVTFMAPGFSAATHATTVLLLRVLLPSFFFVLLTDLGMAILHSFRVFGIPAFSRLLIPLTALMFLLAAGQRYGIVILAIGTLAGATIQIVLIARALSRAGFVYQPLLSIRDPDVRRVLLLVFPFAFSVLAAQAAGVVYRILVSHLPEGSLSALKFGEKITQMTNALFLGSITTIAFPAFSRAVAIQSWEDTRTTMRQAVRLMLFFGIPLTVGIILLRVPLVRLLYERGSFTPEDTQATAAVAAILFLGLIANGLSSLLGHLALALKVTRVSVAVTIATHVVTIGLFAFLAPRFGIRGLALGSAISPYILAGLYVIALRKKSAHLWHVFADASLLKFIVSGAALAAGVQLGRRLGTLAPTPVMSDMITLAAGGALGSAAYAAASWALGIPEVRSVREVLYYTAHRRRS